MDDDLIPLVAKLILFVVACLILGALLGKWYIGGLM